MSTAAVEVPPRRELQGAASMLPLRRVFSFPGMLAGLLVVLSVLTVRGRLSDPDLWWHLKTGEVMWKTHVIPAADFFSYTTGHHAMVPHEWLAQLSIYGAYLAGGYSGLMVWLVLTTSFALIAGYALCALYSGNAKVAFVGALLIWLCSTIGLSIRPQMIGYILLILELVVLHLGRSRNPRWLLWLPPIFAIWVNCHGSFFLGWIVGALLLGTSYCRFQWGSISATPWEPHARRLLGWMLLASAFAVLLNPKGLKQALYPLDLLFHQPLNTSQVEEWKPLVFHDPRGLAVLAALACILILPLLQRAELHLDELLLLSAATWLTFNHQRMLFVFGILAAPTLCRMLAPMWDTYEFARDRILPNAVLMGIAVVVAAVGIPGPSNLEAQVRKSNPVQAVAYMKAHHLGGPLLNAYGYGGYLIWAAPETPVFVDGRTDIFEWTGVLAEYGNWALLQVDPQDLLRKYSINTCLLERQAPIVRVLALLPGWKQVYSDDQSVIFTRTASSGPAAPAVPVR